MAPKRAKPAPIVDLTVDDDDDDLDQPRPKRRRASKKSAAEAVVPAPGGSGGEAGPSSAAPRNPKKKAAVAQERRVDEAGNTVTYRPTASQDVKTRIQRAMPGSSHRMFLVDSRQLAPPGAPGCPSQEFNVLGATGNVYTIRISRQPRCSCPDFAKGHLCKHILFVMLRVLRQRPDNPVIWQRALLPQEVEQVLGAAGGGAAAAGAAAAVDQSVLASERVRQRFAAIAGSGAAAEAAADGGSGVQRPVEGDCPICYEELVVAAAGGRAGEAITFCRACGNNMHKECFGRWASSKRAGGQGVTCVYCRAPWQGDGGGTPGDERAKPAGGEYVNLSQYSDAHRQPASLEELYGSNAYFVMANAGQMGRRQAARLHAAARGWA